MKIFLKNMSDRDVKILIYAVFAITTVFFASTLSLPYVLDETGTVANTAFMAGDDWSFCTNNGRFLLQICILCIILSYLYCIQKQSRLYVQGNDII